MKSVLLVLLYIFALTGCESMPAMRASDRENEAAKSPLSAPRIADLEVSKMELKEGTKVSGKNYFLQDATGETSTLSENARSALKDHLKKMMEDLGYVPVDDIVGAHVVVVVDSGISSPVDDEKLKKLSEELKKAFGKTVRPADLKKSDIKTTRRIYREGQWTEYEDGDRAYFAVHFMVQSYGKRSRRVSAASIRSDDKQWAGKESGLLAAFQAQSGLMAKAPASNEKASGKPGCMPRFGYLEEKSIITQISKNSPAQAAGLKVGDKLLTVDSVPHEEFLESEEGEAVYNELTKVPVKYERNGKVARTEIQPKIICL